MINSTVTTIAAPTIVRDIGGGETLIKWPRPRCAACPPIPAC
jgi:hypothetical protein